jgi:hypothetical protein
MFWVAIGVLGAFIPPWLSELGSADIDNPLPPKGTPWYGYWAWWAMAGSKLPGPGAIELPGEGMGGLLPKLPPKGKVPPVKPTPAVPHPVEPVPVPVEPVPAEPALPVPRAGNLRPINPGQHGIDPHAFKPDYVPKKLAGQFNLAVDSNGEIWLVPVKPGAHPNIPTGMTLEEAARCYPK